MNDAALDFLKELVETPSPSGYEERNAAVFRIYVGAFADTIETDAMGSVIASVNPEGFPKIMLAGHIDEIGYQVSYIDENGYIFFSRVGGHDLTNAVGQRVQIHTAKGAVPGVIGKKPIHVMTPDERTKAPVLEGLWVDVGAVNRTETIDAGIQLGDAITIDAGFTRLVGDRAAARAFDNRVGAWAVAEALRRVKMLQPEAAVFAVATVQEEVGLRGAKTSAFGINPEIGIAVDVTFATDFPSMDKRLHPDVKLGNGPTILRGANANRKLADRLVAQAVEYKIPYQIEVYGGDTGTDANAMQVNRAGMITGLVGIPLRYMHTPCEIVSLADADNAAELMARTAASVKPGESWIPGN